MLGMMRQKDYPSAQGCFVLHSESQASLSYKMRLCLMCIITRPQNWKSLSKYQHQSQAPTGCHETLPPCLIFLLLSTLVTVIFLHFCQEQIISLCYCLPYSLPSRSRVYFGTLFCLYLSNTPSDHLCYSSLRRVANKFAKNAKSGCCAA